MHGSAQAVLQQTPDTQNPLRHSLLLRQSPVDGREQLPFMHGLPEHCASLVQVDEAGARRGIAGERGTDEGRAGLARSGAVARA